MEIEEEEEVEEEKRNIRRNIRRLRLEVDQRRKLSRSRHPSVHKIR